MTAASIGLPDGWYRALSSENKPYYYTREPESAQWECPRLRHENQWLNGDIATEDIYTEHSDVHTITTWEEALVAIWGRRINVCTRRHVHDHSLPAWNTLCYLFHHIGCGVYVLIVGGTLEAFVPFINHNYHNTWSKHVEFPTSTLLEFVLQDHSPGPAKKVEEWRADGCDVYATCDAWDGSILRSVYEMASCSAGKQDDGMYECFINLNEHPVLRANRREPYACMFGCKRPPSILCPTHPWMLHATCSPPDVPDCTTWNDAWADVFSDVYSFNTSAAFLDRHMARIPDWNRDYPRPSIPWDLKDDRCVFRGSAKGNGITPRTNIRLCAAMMGRHVNDPEILDVQITSWSFQYKICPDGVVRLIDPELFPFSQLDMEHERLDDHKFLLYLPGQAGDSEFGRLLSMGSLVLAMSVPKEGWVSRWAKPYVHYIPIRFDNLYHTLMWCYMNDTACRRIARRGQRAARTQSLPYFKKQKHDA